MQAAINASLVDLPSDLPTSPTFRKASQSTMPVLVLAMTSDTLPTSAIFDATDSVIAQRISQVPGVAEARIAGAEQPAIRVQVDSARLAAMNLGVSEVGRALFSANAHRPRGRAHRNHAGDHARHDRPARDARRLSQYRHRLAGRRHRQARRCGDVERGVRNRMSAGWFNGRPAVIVIVFKQPNANVIETVDHIKEMLPQLQEWIPSGIKIEILSDRTQTIRASIHDIQFTLAISIALVMMVVFVFLRRATPVIAAGISVPLSLVGACAAMWVAGFSIDNLSLMALTISVGFVVDDAIVMIENIESNRERGMSRLDAALARREGRSASPFSRSACRSSPSSSRCCSWKA